jgi:hypothetical protein
MASGDAILLLRKRTHVLLAGARSNAATPG